MPDNETTWTLNDYNKEARRTESSVEDFQISVQEVPVARFLHGVCGLCGEAGELMDHAKGAAFYGKEIDRIRVVEELGDALWYWTMCCDAIGVDFDAVMTANIQKLKNRYPERFTRAAYLDRDIAAEGEIIGGVLGSADDPWMKECAERFPFSELQEVIRRLRADPEVRLLDNPEREVAGYSTGLGSVNKEMVKYMERLGLIVRRDYPTHTSYQLPADGDV